MAYVVAEPCIGCKYTDCVEVCPCDCFHEGESMLYIDPVHCIDCDACASACPVSAIFHTDSIPDEWRHYIELNETMAQQTPSITEPKQMRDR
jgi:ferredoxin